MDGNGFINRKERRAWESEYRRAYGKAALAALKDEYRTAMKVAENAEAKDGETKEVNNA